MIRAGYISQEVDTFGDRENGIIAFNLQAGFTGLFIDGVINLFLIGKPVGFFQIEKKILHIRIIQGGAFPVKADGLYDVLAAVSYTHLDVYKRQVMISPIAFMAKDTTQVSSIKANRSPSPVA